MERAGAGEDEGLERIPIQLTHNRATRSVCSLSNPKSGLPDFGHIEWSKSDKSDFDWERGGVRGYGLSIESRIRFLSMNLGPLTPTLSPKGERERSEFAARPDSIRTGSALIGRAARASRLLL